MASDAEAIVEALHELRDAILVHAAAAEHTAMLVAFQQRPAQQGETRTAPELGTFIARITAGYDQIHNPPR